MQLHTRFVVAVDFIHATANSEKLWYMHYLVPYPFCATNYPIYWKLVKRRPQLDWKTDHSLRRRFPLAQWDTGRDPLGIISAATRKSFRKWTNSRKPIRITAAAPLSSQKMGLGTNITLLPPLWGWDSLKILWRLVVYSEIIKSFAGEAHQSQGDECTQKGRVPYHSWSPRRQQRGVSMRGQKPSRTGRLQCPITQRQM